METLNQKEIETVNSATPISHVEMKEKHFDEYALAFWQMAINVCDFDSTDKHVRKSMRALTKRWKFYELNNELYAVVAWDKESTSLVKFHDHLSGGCPWFEASLEDGCNGWQEYDVKELVYREVTRLNPDFTDAKYA